MSVEKLNTKITRYSFRDLVSIKNAKGHRNARYMTAQQHQRLVANIRRDGCLTSLPLVARCETDPDKLLIVSGNHRVDAAREAGIEEIDCIEIIDLLPKKRLVAIQLAHNAIEGQDDQSVLKSLYDELSIEWQEYSGLTDDAFNLDDINVQVISGTHPLFKEVIFSFLANEADAITDLLHSAEKWAKKERPVFVVRMAEFSDFFEAMVAVKKLKNIKNSAIALSVMLELAQEYMRSLENERQETETH